MIKYGITLDAHQLVYNLKQASKQVAGRLHLVVVLILPINEWLLAGAARVSGELANSVHLIYLFQKLQTG